jgi:hypothetical protein
LIALAATACHGAGDPSGPTSVYLSIDNGPGLAVPDELLVTASGDSGTLFHAQRLPATGALVPPPGGGSLLGTVTVYVGADVTHLDLEVSGYADGAWLSDVTATVVVVQGKQVSATVVLAPAGGTDAGVDSGSGQDAPAPADGGLDAPDGGAPQDAPRADAPADAPAADTPAADATPDAGAVEAAETAGCVGSMLAGTSPAPVSPVNLTTEGTLDWRHWGAMSFVDYKAMDAASLISNYTTIGGSSVVDILDARGGMNFEWSDGAPPRNSLTQAPYSVGIQGTGAGFAFTIPAAATPRTAIVYVSGQNDATTFTASLSDGCVADYVASRTDTQAYAAVHRITFQSAAPGAELRVSWVMSSGSDPIGLFAADLF